MNTKYGSECEPHEDTREDIVDKKALKAEQSTVSHFERENQTDEHERMTSVQNIFSFHAASVGQNLRKQIMQMRLVSVDIMPQGFPCEKIHSIQVNKDRFGMDNVISNELAKSLGCLVIRTKDPGERVDITQNNARMSVSVSGATMMWIRLNTQGHNKNDGPVAFTQIVLKVTRSLDSGRFQLILNRATMEELKMIPPSQNKSPQETKQDARCLRKLKKDITRRQEVLRIKRLQKHDKCIREQQIMSNDTFHAASMGQISQ